MLFSLLYTLGIESQRLSSITANPHLASSDGVGLDLLSSSVFHIMVISLYKSLSKVFNFDRFFLYKSLCSKIFIILLYFCISVLLLTSVGCAVKTIPIFSFFATS